MNAGGVQFLQKRGEVFFPELKFKMLGFEVLDLGLFLIRVVYEQLIEVNGWWSLIIDVDDLK